jgi:hypothetical protein
MRPTRTRLAGDFAACAMGALAASALAATFGCGSATFGLQVKPVFVLIISMDVSVQKMTVICRARVTGG